MRTVLQTACHSSNAASASYGPTVYVCVCVCMCGKYAMLLSETKTKQAGVFGWPATKQEEDWWKKKYNQAKLESKVHTKGRTNVFRFSVFCRLKGEKKEFSFFSFLPRSLLLKREQHLFYVTRASGLAAPQFFYLLATCLSCESRLSSMLCGTWLPLLSTYSAQLWHCILSFSANLHISFFFENAPLFCCCDDRVCCVWPCMTRGAVFSK